MTDGAAHPLSTVVRAALAGRFPPADGRVERLPAWRPALEAVVSLTGHGFLCLGDGRAVPDEVAELAADGRGGLSDPRVVTALAGAHVGRHDIDSLDVLLMAAGTSDAAAGHRLVARSERTGHPRIDFARRLRDDVRAYVPAQQTGDDDVLVILATGLAGLTEMSVEVAASRQGAGAATNAIRAALSEVPPGEPVVAMVAPGNAASLRAFLRAGFTPIGSAQVWHTSD